MFIIFLLGPCEPMIPLLYFPAAQQHWGNMLLLIIIYAVCTIATMLVLVLAGYYGISIAATRKAEKYMHVLGGLTILICGAGMVWMEW
jgi:threonine/homoserine/homoserine lactone efflux protein